MRRDGKLLHAAAVMVGTMIGAGIFGIPYVFAQAGFGRGVAWLVGVALFTIGLDLAFARIVLATKGDHQLPGYAGRWTGAWGRRAMAATTFFGLYGALLAYLILFGTFAHNVLGDYLSINPSWYAIIFAVGWSLVWLARIRTLAAVELGLSALYIAAIIIVCILGAPHIQAEHFSGSVAMPWYLPAGVLLFAFGGLTAIPMQRMLLVGRERLLRPSIIWAVGVVAVVYLAFAFVVVGISGRATSPDALAGLVQLPLIVTLGSLLGLLTVSTSYVALGTALVEVFHLDYRVKLRNAWLLTLIPPLLLFVFGLRDFIGVIGWLGWFSIGIDAIIISVAYSRL